MGTPTWTMEEGEGQTLQIIASEETGQQPQRHSRVKLILASIAVSFVALGLVAFCWSSSFNPLAKKIGEGPPDLQLDAGVPFNGTWSPHGAPMPELHCPHGGEVPAATTMFDTRRRYYSSYSSYSTRRRYGAYISSYHDSRRRSYYS